MTFAQLTYREGLRDVEACLRGAQHKLYRLGLRGSVSRSTLADANEHRSSEIYADFCRILIQRARTLYVDDCFCGELDEMIYILDSTSISLCLSLCPWAKFAGSAAVKVNTLLDLRGWIPSFISIKKANYRDCFALDDIPIEPGAFYVMDRGYLDFKRLYHLHCARGYFVTRPLRHVVFKRQESRAKSAADGIRSDQIVLLGGQVASGKYPDRLRRIHYSDKQQLKDLIFITNNLLLPASTIATLYKSRWQIELFFKWIKQNLRIKKFYGTSFNAVKTQIWIAVAVYLLVAIVRKELSVKTPLYRIFQFLSVSIFDEMPILQAFSQHALPELETHSPNQLNLF